MRKPHTSAKAKSRSSRKTPKRRKSVPAKKSIPLRKKPAADPALAGVRPPPPGQGKRGEKGYFGYLLRQAQAASRLTLERSLVDLGVTPPQFVVLTMLKAYPGLSGADLARVALLTPQTVGVIIRNLERARAIRKTPHVDADPARPDLAGKMPASRHGRGAAAGSRLFQQGSSNGPALAVQNCRRSAAGCLAHR